MDANGTTGHALAWLAGYAAPTTLLLAGGQVLLVDISDPAGELLAQPVGGGTVVHFTVPIPAHPSLAGFEVNTQAVHFASQHSFALSNAVDLHLGH